MDVVCVDFEGEFVVGDVGEVEEIVDEVGFECDVVGDLFEIGVYFGGEFGISGGFVGEE